MIFLCLSLSDRITHLPCVLCCTDTEYETFVRLMKIMKPIAKMKKEQSSEAKQASSSSAAGSKGSKGGGSIVAEVTLSLNETLYDVCR